MMTLQPARVLALATLAAGVLVAFNSSLRGMVQLWNASPMYSYAFTVPFISLWMAWSRRDALMAAPLRPARLAAIPLLVVALAGLLAGALTAVQVAQQFAFVLTVPAIVLFLLGREQLRLLAPAIGYLLFMVPFWEAFTEPLHKPFQNNSAAIGIGLMHAVGVPAFREGEFITLPNISLEVARECSGVNYLVAVLALALPLSFVRLNSWPRRLVLIVSALSIAALANGLRVAMIGVLAYWDFGAPLHGPGHVLHGLFVAGIGYVALFAGLQMLETGDVPAPAPAAGARSGGWHARDAWLLAAVFWGVVVLGAAPAAAPVSLARPLTGLPQRLGAWDAAGTGLPSAVTVWDGADEHFARRYRSAATLASVNIWYFAAQAQEHELVNDVVSGLHRQARRRTIAGANGTLDANAVLWPDRGEVGVFWYELGGTTDAGEYTAKLRSAWNTLRFRRSNGAAVLITAATTAGQEEATLRSLEDLAVHLHLALAPHWSGDAAPPDAPDQASR